MARVTAATTTAAIAAATAATATAISMIPARGPQTWVGVIIDDGDNDGDDNDGHR